MICAPGLKLRSCRAWFAAVCGRREPQGHREGWGLVGTCFRERRAILLSAPANGIVRSATTASPQYEKPLRDPAEPTGDERRSAQLSADPHGKSGGTRP